MIPGGWVPWTVLFLVIGAVIITAIIAVAVAREDRRAKRHEREMAKLEHRQSLDETAIETEFVSDDDAEDEAADSDGAEDDSNTDAKPSVSLPTPPDGDLTPDIKPAGYDGRSECAGCGARLSQDERVLHQTNFGGYIETCSRRGCIDEARRLADGRRLNL